MDLKLEKIFSRNLLYMLTLNSSPIIDLEVMVRINVNLHFERLLKDIRFHDDDFFFKESLKYIFHFQGNLALY